MCKNQEFWDDKKVPARKSADCTILLKDMQRYSNRIVMITVIELLIKYSSHIKGKMFWYNNQLQLNKDNVILGWKISLKAW